MRPAEPFLPHEPPSGQPSRLPHRVRLAGEIILGIGLLAAALIYFLAAPEGPTVALDSRAYDYQVQRIGGQTGLLLVHFNNWFDSLWHGERLAYTVGVIAIVIGLACFKIASMLAEAPPYDSRGWRDGDVGR